jgi:hypothetical protein
VVHAVVDFGASFRSSIFLQKLGPDYIRNAFIRARQADPSALLFYNDFLADGINVKSDFIYDMVVGLLAQGTPIDGVSFQMHLGGDFGPVPTGESVRQNLQRFADLGLIVRVSEMDVEIRYITGAYDDRLAEQRAIYHDMVAACLSVARCDSVTFWGFTDKYTWLKDYLGLTDRPLPFDDGYQPKSDEMAYECSEGRTRLMVRPSSAPSTLRRGRIRTDRRTRASDHLFEPSERTHPHHVPRGLGLEHDLFLRERVDTHAGLGRRLPGDGDSHHAGHLEDAGAELRQVGLDQGSQRVKHGGDVAPMDADVLGDGAEHVALAAGLRGSTDLERLAEVKLGERPRGDPVLLRGGRLLLLGSHTRSSSFASSDVEERP